MNSPHPTTNPVPPNPGPRDPEHSRGPAVVAITGLVKIFRDFWRRPKVRAVDGLNLDIHPGEVFGLLGPNGSGKSTTMKILLGLLHPTAGTVRVLDRSPRDVEAKRRIGYLPEESYLYKHLTPRETLSFYARLFGLDSRTARSRIDQLLEMVGLQHSANRRVGEFSKGMARRVGLAQALINDPQLIFLDEPTSGLDPIGCRQMKDLLSALAARGKTILLSSHLLADVEDVCDRVAVLYNGRIRAHGRLHELLETPDRVRLTLPALPPDRMAALLKAVRDIVRSEPDVDHPSMNLEQFFLQVVSEAHRAATHESGAVQAGRLAAFLATPAPAADSATPEPDSKPNSGPEPGAA